MTIYGRKEHSAFGIRCAPDHNDTGFGLRVTDDGGQTFDIGTKCTVDTIAWGNAITGLDGMQLTFCGVVQSTNNTVCCLVWFPFDHPSGVIAAVPMQALRVTDAAPPASLHKLMGTLQGFHDAGARFDKLPQPQLRSFVRSFYLGDTGCLHNLNDTFRVIKVTQPGNNGSTPGDGTEETTRMSLTTTRQHRLRRTTIGAATRPKERRRNSQQAPRRRMMVKS